MSNPNAPAPTLPLSTAKHLSSQFSSELNAVSARALEMGGLVEDQIQHVMCALNDPSTEFVDTVLRQESLVNTMELEIDRELTSIIARRQPTARDLRLLLAIAKTTANLERVGDETTKIARMIKSVHASGAVRTLPAQELLGSAGMASDLICQALDAFARLDVPSAYHILKEDDKIDAAFDGFVRKLITYMMEDPRTISSALNLVFVAKAIERIGDHAKNIAEQIIYIVDGDDVRHTPTQDLEPFVR